MTVTLEVIILAIVLDSLSPCIPIPRAAFLLEVILLDVVLLAASQLEGIPE